MSHLRLVLLFAISYLLFAQSALAITNPLSVPNNKFGIHILSPDEVMDAAKLVNSSGGDWGYVTIPMRSDDRDRDKWLLFFQKCRIHHLIPIIRLTTYVDNDAWVTPTVYDLVDFANFLSDLPWPSGNRYIILFNEPNHAKEWGGHIDPQGYASLLIDSNQIFKSRSDNFFLLTAGLDMSAPNSVTSMDALLFYRRMTALSPDWYANIDGLSVHAYPNPGFSATPKSKNRFGIFSFNYETNLLANYGYTKKPIFITETGYIGQGDFYQTAFSTAWNDSRIVTVTPFLLFAGAGDFTRFSFLDLSKKPKNNYLEYASIPKIAGSPLLSDQNKLAPPVTPAYSTFTTPVPQANSFLDQTKKLISPASPQMKIGDTTVDLEIADTPALRESGLSYRPSLPKNSGVLFIFPDSQIQFFWMFKMNFPLDFIWINNQKIVGLNSKVPPPGQTNNNPAVISSLVPINWVLEVNAGFISDHHIKVGDQVVLNSP